MGSTHRLVHFALPGLPLVRGGAWPLAGGELRRMWLCRLRFAPFEVPRCIRAAMSLTERVVSRRNRAAISSLSGSFFRRFSKSPSFQPSRRNSAATIRSAFAWAAWRCSSPEWCSPRSPSMRRSICRLKPSLPDTSHAASLPKPRDRSLPCAVAPSMPRTVAARPRYPLESRARPTTGPPGPTAADARAPPDRRQNCSTGTTRAAPRPGSAWRAPGSDARNRRQSANTHCRCPRRAVICTSRSTRGRGAYVGG